MDHDNDADASEMWRAAQAAEYLGLGSEKAARAQLSRWRIPRAYQPGPNGGAPVAYYNADAIRTAHAARPGKGARTDLNDRPQHNGT